VKSQAGIILQIDPYFPLHRPPTEFIHPESPLDETTLPSHIIAVTHAHRDHNCMESQHRFLRANRGTRLVGPKDAATLMMEGRIPKSLIHEVGVGDVVSFGDIEINFVYAKPPEGDPEAGIPAPPVVHLGMVVVAGGRRLYFSGDPIATFAEREDLLEPVRALRPEVGFLTTHPSEGEFPDFEGSYRIAEALGLRRVVPAHYECFVKRTFNPREWEKGLRSYTCKIEPLIIPYNQAVVL
jgi:L-ascorbate metabolism protein UlaG (beta-lactamase superfamily)